MWSVQKTASLSQRTEKTPSKVWSTIKSMSLAVALTCSLHTSYSQDSFISQKENLEQSDPESNDDNFLLQESYPTDQINEKAKRDSFTILVANLFQILDKVSFEKLDSTFAIIKKIQELLWKQHVLMFQEAFPKRIVKKIRAYFEAKWYLVFDDWYSPFRHFLRDFNFYNSWLLIIIHKDAFKTLSNLCIEVYKDEIWWDKRWNKSILSLVVEKSGQKILLINTHMQSRKDGDEKKLPTKKKQIDQLLSHIAKRIPEVDQVVLAGDLNMTFWSPLYQYFIEQAKTHPGVYESLWLEEFWSVSHLGTNNKWLKIDYILSLLRSLWWRTNFDLTNKHFPDHQMIWTTIYIHGEWYWGDSQE